MPSPAESRDTQNGASRLRLATCHVSTTVIVRSSKPGAAVELVVEAAPEDIARSSSWPGAHSKPTLADTLWFV